jgi:hypothetical protein
MGDKNGTKKNSNTGSGGSSASGAVSGGNLSPVQSQAIFGTSTYAGSNATEIGTQIVKEKLGLQTNISNPNEAATGGNITGYSSTTGNQMYGGAASEETNKYLVSIGEATVGNLLPDGTYSYHLTPTGHKIKYGSYTPGQAQTPSGMGSGAGGGIMGATPISQEMFESQQKIKMLGLGALSLFAPFPVSSALGYAANQARKDQYSNYVSNFNQSMSSTSYASNTPVQKDTKTTSTALASGTTTINDAGVDGGPSEAARLKKLALTKKNAALDAKRKLFNTTNQTITGAMV